MSINLSAIAVRKDGLSDIFDLFSKIGFTGLIPSGKAVFEDIVGHRFFDKAGCSVRGWSILVDPFLFRDLKNCTAAESDRLWPPVVERGLEDLSREGEVISFLISDASGSYGFSLYRDGVQQRCFLVQSGKTLKDVGNQFEQESRTLGTDTRQTITKLVSALAFDLSVLSQIQFETFRIGVNE